MIETLPTGFKCIVGDTHLSKWLREDHGGAPSLHGDAALLAALAHIKPGDYVVDVGCNIGLHSHWYAKSVGPSGAVFGFDPNPEVIECARNNCPEGRFENVAIGAREGHAVLELNENVGASHIEKSEYGDVRITSLDVHYREPRLNLIKIDAEGFEIDVLFGARETIARHQPIMVIEVNDGALMVQRWTSQDLLAMIEQLGYSWKIIQSGLKPTDPQFDVLCVPAYSPPT